jgi:two-component system, cell cycle response regulator
MPTGSKRLSDKSGLCTSPGSHLSVAVLQAENQRLRAQLDAMMREARLNQEKMRRFDQLERQVIGASSLAALIDTLLVQYKALFELDAVTLALVDPQYEVGRVLGNPQAQADGLLFLDSDVELLSLYGRSAKPQLAGRDGAHEFLFEDVPTGLASVALLPLLHHGQFIGSLNLGSRDAQRFVTGNSTDFLERLAALVAVCLDSALATERLKLAGLTDILTGVHNRRYFESRCLEEANAARRSGLPLVCMFLDVDHFKKLNDTQGHQAGDEVLRYVANLIKVQLRGCDVVARYGGEEFVVLLPATPYVAGVETAERIRRIMAAQSFPVKTKEAVRVTVSIGVSMLDASPGQNETSLLVADMIARADKALYAAKEGGRNRVVAATAC